MKVELSYGTSVPDQFEQQYILLRRKEGRIYSDEEVKQLPAVPDGHPLAKEWKIRSFSVGRLTRYLEKKSTSLKILEVGCGNGWLSHRLALLQNSEVTGIDINSFELKQANRVFSRKNLDFIYGDIRNGILNDSFNVVVFAASLQYFSSVQEIINSALNILVPGGEIHILDTHFYSQHQLEEAEQRTNRYFNELGFPSMKDYYFHHSLKELDPYAIQILYDPNALSNKIFKTSPFYWIRIKKC
jgi:ubiquinone/menaquinone biosynthesis C-methylase UbiE